MAESDKLCGIKRTGTIRLEDGVLVCRQDATGECIGRILIGVAGLYFDGLEPIAVQKNDPPKWRGACRYDDGSVKGGVIISGNRLRDDDQMEENGYLRIANTDVPTGDDRGMFIVNLRCSDDPQDMQVAIVATTDYSEEQWGYRRLWTGACQWMGWLWKFANPGDDPPATGGTPAPPPEPAAPWYLEASQKRFRFYIQDDGNATILDMSTNPPTPIWAAK